MAFVGHYFSPQTIKVLSYFPKELGKYLEELQFDHSLIFQEFKHLSIGEKNERHLGKGLKAIEQCYKTTTKENAILESHQNYIDFQFIFEGGELMQTQDISKMKIKIPYSCEKDLIIFNECDSMHLFKMQQNDFAIFYPSDVHRSTLRVKEENLVRKVVIKIPIES